MGEIQSSSTRTNAELVELIFCHLRVAFFNALEFFKVVKRYYIFSRFLWIDVLLKLLYLIESPFQVSKRYLKSRGEKELYTYGETPLTTLDHIVKECRVLSKDHFYELGCGTGRTCFWLANFVKCKVTGVEQIETFITRAGRIKKWVKENKTTFNCCDMREVDLSSATVIYLFATTLDEKMLEMVTEKLASVRPGTKVITVSHPLMHPRFKVEKCFKARYPWGESDVYLNTKKTTTEPTENTEEDL